MQQIKEMYYQHNLVDNRLNLKTTQPNPIPIPNVYQTCRQECLTSPYAISNKLNPRRRPNANANALTSLAAVLANPPRSTNAFNPNPTGCLISKVVCDKH